MQCVAVVKRHGHCNTLQHTATHCNTLQHATTAGSAYGAVYYCNTPKHCNTLQHTATHYNKLTATHSNKMQGLLTVQYTTAPWGEETLNMNAVTVHCVAVCCRVLHVLQCVAACCSILWHLRGRDAEYECCHGALCCSPLQCISVCCSVLQGVAVCCSVLQCLAVCCRSSVVTLILEFMRYSIYKWLGRKIHADMSPAPVCSAHRYTCVNIYKSM